MKITLQILGVLLALMGAIWFLQGINVLTVGNSPMIGDRRWAYYAEARLWSSGLPWLPPAGADADDWCRSPIPAPVTSRSSSLSPPRQSSELRRQVSPNRFSWLQT